MSSKSILSTDADHFFWTMLDIQPIFNHIHFPQQIPIVLYTNSRFEEKDAIVLRQLMQQRAPSSHLCLILFFMETTRYLEAALKVLSYTLQKVYAYDVVPLIYENYRQIVEAKDPAKAFRQYVIHNVNFKVISPFITQGPTPDFMFFGREQELYEISLHANSTNYALIGGRLIGKTSILKRLQRKSLPEASFRAYYCDCSLTPTQADLIQAVILDRSWFPDPPSNQPSSFASLIQSLPNDKPIVILLDEADKLIASDRSADYPLFNSLRALANVGHCKFVLSGEHKLRSEMTNPESPLYNFANELFVRHLDFRSVRELIIHPMKELEIEMIDEDNIVRRIWNFTSGHPNVVQRLCQRLIIKLNQDREYFLKITDVDAVITDPAFLEYDFLKVYWERADVLERLCTLVMARDTDTFTLSAVRKALNQLKLRPTLNQVHEALENLVDLRNILSRTSNGYMFAVAAFPEVISKTGSFNDTVARFCEEYLERADK